MNLSTPLRRSFFALPLLVVAITGFASIERPITPTLQTWLPAGDDCSDPMRPAGARGLARMPGDLSTLHRRFRCAA